ncbi:MAG: hypothetical protein GTN88_05455, partial [Gammaproteobacteria bacterium]|nr:hypothetical protein [Gammaproteobacteria bacterium]
MGRAVAAVIVGYVTMFAVVFVSFSLAFLAMGVDNAFRAGSYEVSGLWIVVSIVLGFIAAVIGGLVCAKIAKGGKAPKALAVVVLALGLILAVPVITKSGEAVPEVRTESVGPMEAMQQAEQPVWIALLNPILGAVGVLVGAGLSARRRTASGP